MREFGMESERRHRETPPRSRTARYLIVVVSKACYENGRCRRSGRRRGEEESERKKSKTHIESRRERPPFGIAFE